MTDAERLAKYDKAHARVKQSFTHKAKGKCTCPYCTKDVEDLIIHAAEKELRVMELEEEVKHLSQKVKELLEKPPVAPIVAQPVPLDIANVKRTSEDYLRLLDQYAEQIQKAKNAMPRYNWDAEKIPDPESEAFKRLAEAMKHTYKKDYLK